MSDRTEKISICFCGAPLIPTMAFRKYEFYCLECGQKHGMFGGRIVDTTDELWDLYEVLLSEWNEHAGEKLITDSGWYKDCPKCESFTEYHWEHASDEEKTAHEKALAWLKQRKAVAAT